MKSDFLLVITALNQQFMPHCQHYHKEVKYYFGKYYY